MDYPEIDFATVLASGVHDMKNSLCMLLQSMETLQQELAEKSLSASEELARIHYEATRLNTNLLQLLSLYRIEKDQMPLHIDEYHLNDLCDEVLSKNQLYSAQKNIQVEIECPRQLRWFFDNDLVSNLINDMFINALRYSHSKLLLRALTQDDQLVVEIHDDGDGYPADMLDNSEEGIRNLNLTAARTGLGLFFAHMIARAHRNKGQAGHIELNNGGRFGGAVFRLILP